MFVRKRKAARKKRKVIEEQGSLPEDYDGENEEDVQAEKDMPSYAEHAFTFTSFEMVCLILLRSVLALLIVG